MKTIIGKRPLYCVAAPQGVPISQQPRHARSADTTIDARRRRPLRQLRLNALRETPEAFGSSYEEEHTLTLDDIRAWVATDIENAMFGVFIDGALTGMAGVGRQHN